MTLLQTPTSPTTLTPNQQVQALTGRDYLSFSQVNLFRSCPRKFAFSYVERIPPEFKPVAFAFGSGIHAGLEASFQLKLEGEATTLEHMLEAFDDAWAKEEAKDPDIPIRFNKSHPDKDSLRDQACRMFQAFLDADILKEGQVLAIEEGMLGQLAEDLPDILSYADLIIEEEKQLRIIDFKTSRSKWKQEDIPEKADQLLLYRLLGQDLVHELKKPMHLEYLVLTKHKKPVIQQFEVEVDHQRLQRLESTFRQVWEAIQVGNFYPVPSPMNCSNCQWRINCEAYK